jgi:hypothetical protein
VCGYSNSFSKKDFKVKIFSRDLRPKNFEKNYSSEINKWFWEKIKNNTIGNNNFMADIWLLNEKIWP